MVVKRVKREQFVSERSEATKVLEQLEAAVKSSEDASCV